MRSPPAAHPNNGMHPTAGTLLVMLRHGAAAAGDAGRYALLNSELIDIWEKLMVDEPSDRELLWRQYNLHLDLYKCYLDLSIKANAFFYLITGGILAFYFSHPAEGLIKYSLLLPIIMSLAFGFAFIYGAVLMRVIRMDIFQLRDQLGFETAPDVQILSVLLYAFGIIFIVVAIAMILLLILR